MDRGGGIIRNRVMHFHLEKKKHLSSMECVVRRIDRGGLGCVNKRKCSKKVLEDRASKLGLKVAEKDLEIKKFPNPNKGSKAHYLSRSSHLIGITSVVMSAYDVIL